MQINEINWYHNKKIDLLKQINDLQQKSYKMVIEQYQIKVKQVNELKEKYIQLQQLKKLLGINQCTFNQKIQQLENVIVIRQNQVSDKIKQLDRLKEINQGQQKIIKELQQILMIKQNQYSNTLKENKIKYQEQRNKAEFSLKNQQAKIRQIVEGYQKIIKEKELFYQERIKDCINKIKQQNQVLLHELQQKYTKKQANSIKQDRLFERQNKRLLQENKKLLQLTNQNKMKLLSLQTELMNEKNHIKIRLKQNQIRVDNMKKQIEFLKQSQSRLNMKNKVLVQKNEELVWQIKQIQIKYSEENKKIKKLSEKQLKEIIHKSSEEVEKLKLVIKNIRTGQLHEIEQQNGILKKKLQQMDIQLNQVKSLLEVKNFEYVTLKNQSQQISKMKKQIGLLRQNNLKKCQQIQVLEQQIKRLKLKSNKLASTLQEFQRNKQMMQKQNKMLLEQIIFLRDKKNKYYNKSRNFMGKVEQSLSNNDEQNDNNILQMRSQRSQNIEDVEQYKQVIKQLDKGMQEALIKIQQKNQIIQKQKSMIDKMERIIAYGK